MAGISSKAAGGLENKKKYNGIEFDNDLDLNIYEAFYRDLDPQTGRFLQIDPKSEKYFCLTPYNAMANNPVFIFDKLGDDLELTGKEKNVKRAIEDINKILDGYYVVRIDKNGKVQITTTDKEGERTRETTGFYNILSRIVYSKEGTVKIEVVSKDSKVDMDRWFDGKMDIADIEKFGNGKFASTASMMTHTLVEQESKQIKNKSAPGKEAFSYEAYFRDHEPAEDAEMTITGYKRATAEMGDTKPNPWGNSTGTFIPIYIEPTNNPTGNKYIYHQVEIKFRNGNIVKVKQDK